MAGPPSALRSLQLGLESTRGTGVPATAKLMGATNMTWRPMDVVDNVPQLGRLGPSPTLVQQQQSGEVDVEAILSYEELPFFWDSLFGVATPGAGPGYTRTYAPPVSAISVPRSNTIEIGVPTTAPYRLDGGILTKMSLKMASNDYWRAAPATFIGKKSEANALASLNDRTVEVIRTADTQAYFDTSATVGNTQVVATVIAAELDIDTKRHNKFFLGSINPGDFGEAVWEGKLKTTLEFNATAKAFVDALLSSSPVSRIIQLKATSGAKVATIDFAGYIDSGLSLWGDRNGNMIVDITWAGYYVTILTNWLNALVTNAVETMP